MTSPNQIPQSGQPNPNFITEVPRTDPDAVGEPPVRFEYSAEEEERRILGGYEAGDALPKNVLDKVLRNAGVEVSHNKSTRPTVADRSIPHFEYPEPAPHQPSDGNQEPSIDDAIPMSELRRIREEHKRQSDS